MTNLKVALPSVQCTTTSSVHKTLNWMKPLSSWLTVPAHNDQH